MFRKTLLILFIALILISCKKKDDNLRLYNEGFGTEMVSMQDIANEMEQYGEDPYITNSEIDQTTITPPPPPSTPPASNQTTPPPSTPREPEAGDFTVQFMSSKDRDKVDEVRRKLDAAAYFSEIIPVEINGEQWYRLRLRGAFSNSYATYLAQRIQSEFTEITDYWVTRR